MPYKKTALTAIAPALTLAFLSANSHAFIDVGQQKCITNEEFEKIVVDERGMKPTGHVSDLEGHAEIYANKENGWWMVAGRYKGKYEIAETEKMDDGSIALSSKETKTGVPPENYTCLTFIGDEKGWPNDVIDGEIYKALQFKGPK